LIGVADERARRFKEWLERSHGECECLTGEAAQTFEQYDAVVLGVGEQAAPATVQNTVIESSRSPVLAIGTHEALVPLIALLRKPARDFALDSCSEHELCLRVAALVSPPHADSKRESPTIVVADDDRVTLGLITTALTAHGFVCHAAMDGDEALELIKRLRPAVVVLDVYMPRKNGFAVLQEVRRDEATAHTRVLMLTGNGERDYVRRASALRADGYIVKPFQAAKLVERIRTLIETPH
jgi:CheY-like chemotaxis protein